MKSVHIDCDPGQDDAIAILYALGSGLADVKSISVVGGNADVRNCARNALQVLELAGQPHIPVYKGAAAPLKRSLHSLPEVFGESGMAGAEHLPEPSVSCAFGSARECLLALQKDIIIVALGPLTNLALALQEDPSFAGRIGALIIMGGCAHPEPVHGWMGNYKAPNASDYAEYNFAVDPEAAKIVFSSDIRDISIIGVDITRGVLYDGDLDARLRMTASACARTAADILSTVGAEDHADYAALKKSADDPVRGIHDVVAMGYALNPQMFTSTHLPLCITTEGPAPGQTLIDDNRPDHKGVRVITDLKKDRFLDSMVRFMAALP